MTYQYRIKAKYRQWIGKPDPSGFSTFEVCSNDPSWIHEKATELTRHGHKVLRLEKLENGKWKQL